MDNNDISQVYFLAKFWILNRTGRAGFALSEKFSGAQLELLVLFPPLLDKSSQMNLALVGVIVVCNAVLPIVVFHRYLQLVWNCYPFLQGMAGGKFLSHICNSRSIPNMSNFGDDQPRDLRDQPVKKETSAAKQSGQSATVWPEDHHEKSAGLKSLYARAPTANVHEQTICH